MKRKSEIIEEMNRLTEKAKRYEKGIPQFEWLQAQIWALSWAIENTD